MQFHDFRGGYPEWRCSRCEVEERWFWEDDGSAIQGVCCAFIPKGIETDAHTTHEVRHMGETVPSDDESDDAAC